MTWKTAGEALVKRWWFLLLCAVVAAAAGAGAAHLQKPTFVVSQTVSDVPGLKFGLDPGTGSQIPSIYVERPTSKSGWKVANWQNQAIAQKAASDTQSPISVTTFLSGLRLPPSAQQNPKSATISSKFATSENVKPATLTFTYQTSSKPRQSADLLKTYLTAFLSARRTAILSQIPGTIKTLQQRHKQLGHPAAQSLLGHQKTNLGDAIAAFTSWSKPDTLDRMIHTIGIASVVKTKSPLRAPVAAAGGALIGLLAGAMLLLALRWGRGRVTAADELGPLERPIIAVDSNRGGGLDTVRAELEVSGVGTSKSVVAVGTSEGREGHTSLALELAHSFAEAGIPTVYMSVDLTGAGLTGAHDVCDFLAHGATIETLPLAQNLVWVPTGQPPAEGLTVTAANASSLVASASQFGRIVIMELGPVESDPSSRLFAHASDIVILQVNKGRSRGTQVYNAALTLRRATPSPLIVCFDVGRPAKRPVVPEPEPAAPRRAGTEVSVGS